MKSVLCTISACLALLPPFVIGEEFTPHKHAEYQEVNDDGTGAWPASGAPYPIELTGVVINNPWDMLDYSNSADQPQWQVCIQATDANDFGGTTLYMRKFIPWDPSQNYTDAEWSAEMDRINYPEDPSKTQPPMQRGDVVRVQALAPGLFYRGKYNVNEQHNKLPAYDFSITILQRGTTPAAASLQLTDLKDASNNFLFDETRQSGCEHYQGSLVHLENLLLADPVNWALGGTVTVSQGDLTFPMRLGLDSALAAVNPITLHARPFSVTAVLDQEDASAPYTGGYRLWLTSATDLLSDFVAGDYNGNRLVDAADYTVWRDSLGSTVASGTGADGNFDTHITQEDYGVWKDHFANPPASSLGTGSSTPAKTLAVPEPGALALLAASALVGLSKWRCRSRRQAR
jgi:hypothetical protein